MNGSGSRKIGRLRKGRRQDFWWFGERRKEHKSLGKRLAVWCSRRQRSLTLLVVVAFAVLVLLGVFSNSNSVFEQKLRGGSAKHVAVRAEKENTWDARFELAGLVGGESTTASFTVRVHPEWAPLGAKRFGELVDSGFYRQARIFRTVKDFMVQFGMSAEAAKVRHARGGEVEGKRGR